MRTVHHGLYTPYEDAAVLRGCGTPNPRCALGAKSADSPGRSPGACPWRDLPPSERDEGRDGRLFGRFGIGARCAVDAGSGYAAYPYLFLLWKQRHFPLPAGTTRHSSFFGHHSSTVFGMTVPSPSGQQRRQGGNVDSGQRRRCAQSGRSPTTPRKSGKVCTYVPITTSLLLGLSATPSQSPYRIEPFLFLSNRQRPIDGILHGHCPGNREPTLPWANRPLMPSIYASVCVYQCRAPN